MTSIKEELLREVSEAFDDVTVAIASLRESIAENRILREDIVEELEHIEEMLT